MTFIACDQPNQQIPVPTATETVPLPLGKVIPSIALASAYTKTLPNQYYALYLPSAHDSSQIWPVIFIFDSQAKGVAPLNSYATLAEEFGYILIGSNYWENGIDIRKSLAHFNGLFNGANTNYNIDKERVYTMGFSGGARIAAKLAISTNRINGVIGCGAGFAVADDHVEPTFHYLGIAGTRDFNFLELYELDEMLTARKFIHHMLTFDGIHEWPDTNTMRKGFEWLDVQAIRTGDSPHADKLKLTNWFIRDLERAELLRPSVYDFYIEIKRLDAYYYDVPDGAQRTHDLVARYSTHPDVLSTKALIEEILKKEGELERGFARSFSAWPIEKWRSEVAKLNGRVVDSTTNRYERESKQRILGYLSLVTYMHCDRAIKDNDLPLAGKFIQVYAIIDPENPEHAYLSAKIASRKNDKAKCMEALNDCVSLGFNDVERLTSDVDFIKYHGMRGFDDVVDVVDVMQ